MSFHSICLSFLQIFDLNGTKIGKISKKWAGVGREFFTDLDYFGIKFPMILDVYGKVALLAACMLIVSKKSSRNNLTKY